VPKASRAQDRRDREYYLVAFGKHAAKDQDGNQHRALSLGAETETYRTMSTINERIAREVFGFSHTPPNRGLRHREYIYLENGDYVLTQDGKFQPDTNPTDAMSVLKKCAEKSCVFIACTKGRWFVENNYHSGEGETLEVATCAFALALFSPPAQAFNPDDK
jgi:hypothetical protein